jgi:igA peptidase M64 family protein
VNFGEKWQDMLPRGTKIPTPSSNKVKDRYSKIGVYEGGGYQSKGVFRAFQDCRMKTNEAPAFCAVCQRALRRMIEFYTK